jgi:hypothetical protein
MCPAKIHLCAAPAMQACTVLASARTCAAALDLKELQRQRQLQLGLRCRAESKLWKDILAEIPPQHARRSCHQHHES